MANDNIELKLWTETIGADGLTDTERRVRDTEAALTDLVAFIDGLSFSQLDRVPGLFAETRRARMVLRDDPVAAELRKHK